MCQSFPGCVSDGVSGTDCRCCWCLCLSACSSSAGVWLSSLLCCWLFLAASLVVLAILRSLLCLVIWLYAPFDALAFSSSVELIVWGYVWLFGQCFLPRSTVRLPGPDNSHGLISHSICWSLSLGLCFCMVDSPLVSLLALQKGGYHTESLSYRKWLFPCLRFEHVLWWGNWTDSRGRTLSGGDH